MTGRVKENVAWLAGGEAGLGAAAIKLLERAGAKTVLANSDAAAAGWVRVAIESAGGFATDFVADVSDPAHYRAIIDFALKRYGAFDILHNRAFALHVGPIEPLTVEGWHEPLWHTVTTPFLGIKRALPVMRRREADPSSTSRQCSDSRRPWPRRLRGRQGKRYQLTLYAAIEHASHGIKG